MAEVMQEAVQEPVKMSISEIREKLVSLNAAVRQNPALPLEMWQRATVSLLVELCDRADALLDATGKSVRRLTERTDKLDQDVQDLAASLLQVTSPPSSTSSSEVMTTTTTTTTKENPPSNGKKKNGEVASVPAVAPPVALPADAASAAASLNGIVPAMPPGVTVTVKP